jgi:di/tricarboxylate transporter
MADTKPRVFRAQLLVRENGFSAGKTLAEVLAKTGGEMRVERIRRGDNLFLAKLPTVRLQAGDQLFVKDTPENLKRFEGVLDATLYSAADTVHPVDETTPLTAEGQQLAEIVVTSGSPLYLRSLEDAPALERYGLLPLAIHRAGSPGAKVTGDLNEIRMHAGDVLLVQGSRRSIEALKSAGEALVLDGTTDLPRAHHSKRALAVFLLVVSTAAFGIMPIALSALIGVGLMLASGCLTWRDAARSLPTPVIMIIVASLALGKALVGTGMAEYLAAGFVNAASGLPPPAILSAFMFTIAVLTNIVSNNAAAVIGTPIAIATAQQLGVDPVPFVLAVLFGANMSFVTPFGYQTNLLVMSAGGYRFSDFVRVGMPLAIIMWAGFSIVLPLFYALN